MADLTSIPDLLTSACENAAHASDSVRKGLLEQADACAAIALAQATIAGAQVAAGRLPAAPAPARFTRDVVNELAAELWETASRAGAPAQLADTVANRMRALLAPHAAG